MPEYKCRRAPQSFLLCREITRDLTPREFLHCYYNLRHIITTAESDIQTLMHFRGWLAHGASSGPKCRMRKTLAAGRTVETSDKIAPEIEAMLCFNLEKKSAPATPPSPPAPRRRRRKS